MSTRTITRSWERGTEVLSSTYSVDSDLGFDVGPLTIESGASAYFSQALDVSQVTDIFIENTQEVKFRVNGVNELQTITITGSPTGGTFTITYSGQTTGAIAYNATAATVQAELELLSNIGAGDVVVTGGPLPGTALGVEFRKALGCTNVSQLTSSSSLTGGTAPAIVHATTRAGVAAAQEITIPANVGYDWHEAEVAYRALVFTSDWTGMTIDNDSGAPATVTIRGGTDL